MGGLESLVMLIAIIGGTCGVLLFLLLIELLIAAVLDLWDWARSRLYARRRRAPRADSDFIEVGRR